jgi:small-conductance mechanosensitive channel
MFDPTVSSYSLQDSINASVTLFVTQIATFLPRFFGALIIVVLGTLIARTLRGLLIGSLRRMKLSASLERTPFGQFLYNTEIKHTAEVVVSNVIYWILLLFVAYTALTVLGLQSVSGILNQILLYIPKVISAILILLLGIMLAGLAEAFVKGLIKSVDPHTGRIVGKVASYLVIVLSAMAAISELGIAQQFILILFTGFVAAVSVALGLAFGLGSKHTVERMMGEWYERMRGDE